MSEFSPTRRRILKGIVGVAAMPVVAKTELILPTASLTQTVAATTKILPMSRWLVVAPNWAVSRVLYESFCNAALDSGLHDGRAFGGIDRLNQRFITGEHTYQFVSASNRLNKVLGMEVTGAKFIGDIPDEVTGLVLSRTCRWPNPRTLAEHDITPNWPEFNEHLQELIDNAPLGDILEPEELLKDLLVKHEEFVDEVSRRNSLAKPTPPPHAARTRELITHRDYTMNTQDRNLQEDAATDPGISAAKKPDGAALSTAEHTQEHGDKIKGYRKLTPDEVDMINDVKRLEKKIAELYAKLDCVGFTDKRWLSIARTNFEQGAMAMTRAVARPVSPFDSGE